MLEARHLVKRYSGSRVVDDVSFVVRPGDVLGYLGPNGSGKSTTVQMLTGLVEPSEGHVLFEDRPHHRRSRRLPPAPRLRARGGASLSFLSGREHLELMGRLRELPPRLLDAASPRCSICSASVTPRCSRSAAIRRGCGRRC